MFRNVQWILKLLALGLVSAFSQPSHAMRCLGWVSVNGGNFICSEWRAESPCEQDLRNCVPVIVGVPTGTGGTDDGRPIPPGPGGREPLEPDQMSCRQLNDLSAKQEAIIKQMEASINKVLESYMLAEQGLNGPLSETAIKTANEQAAVACASSLNDDVESVCVERPGKPPRCPPATPAQVECRKKRGVAEELAQRRMNAEKARDYNDKLRFTLGEKKDRAINRFHDLEAAKAAKGEACR